MKNGNTLWWDVIWKEMKNVCIMFKVHEGEEKDLHPGYQEINDHMIFDEKMGKNFRHKACMVADGHSISCIKRLCAYCLDHSSTQQIEVAEL